MAPLDRGLSVVRKNLLRIACLSAVILLAGCAGGGQPELRFERIVWLVPDVAPGHPAQAATFAEFELRNNGRKNLVVEGVRGKDSFAVAHGEWRRADRDAVAEMWDWESPWNERLDIAPRTSVKVLVPLDEERRHALDESKWRFCVRAVSDWVHPVCAPAQDFKGLTTPADPFSLNSP